MRRKDHHRQSGDDPGVMMNMTLRPRQEDGLAHGGGFLVGNRGWNQKLPTRLGLARSSFVSPLVLTPMLPHPSCGQRLRLRIIDIPVAIGSRAPGRLQVLVEAVVRAAPVDCTRIRFDSHRATRTIARLDYPYFRSARAMKRRISSPLSRTRQCRRASTRDGVVAARSAVSAARRERARVSARNRIELFRCHAQALQRRWAHPKR